jgi:hypothetical protein
MWRLSLVKITPGARRGAFSEHQKCLVAISEAENGKTSLTERKCVRNEKNRKIIVFFLA